MTGYELRQKVCSIINAWIGATKGSAKHQEILSIYNSYTPLARGYKVQTGDAYCATTVSAAWIKAGIAPYTGTECGVGAFIAVAQGKGIWQENDGYVPQIGDAVCYDWSDSGVGDNRGYGDHIGIVTQVNGTTSFVVTEGNMSGGKTGQRTMEVNGRYIRGFITPDYDRIAAELGGTRYKVGWNQDETGWWYSPDGETYYASRWAWITDAWYHFDAHGYMDHDCEVMGTDGNIYRLDGDGRAHLVQATPKEEEDTDMDYERWKRYMDRYLEEKAAEAPGEWSKDARAWAEETGILQGDTQGRMMYEAPVTREQLVTVLYRQAQRA